MGSCCACVLSKKNVVDFWSSQQELSICSADHKYCSSVWGQERQLITLVFSPGTPVFPSPQKPTLPNSNSIWNARTRFNEFWRTLKCFVGKQLQFTIGHWSVQAQWSKYIVLLCLSAVWSLSLGNSGCSTFPQITEHVVAYGRFIKNKLLNFPLASATTSVLSTDFKSRLLTQHCPHCPVNTTATATERVRQKCNRLR